MKTKSPSDKDLKGMGPLFTIILEMDQTPPEIPLPDNIDLAGLKEILGSDLKFTTLPIGKIGAVAKDGTIFAQPFVESLVQQVNDKHTEGRWGHYDPWEANFSYDPPAIRWLAAVIDEKTGLAWGKLVPLTETAKNHFLLADMTKSRVGSSLWATDLAYDENDALVYGRLLSIDIASPDRVGVKEAAAAPAMTTQIAVTQEDKPVEPTQEEMLQELATLRDQQATTSKTIKRLDKVDVAMTSIRALFELGPEDDVVQHIQGLIDQVEDYAKENRDLLADSIAAKVKDKVMLESARPMITEMIADRKPSTRKQIDKALDEIIARDSIKQMLALKVVEESGGAVNPTTENPNNKAGWKQYVEIPDDDAESAK